MASRGAVAEKMDKVRKYDMMARKERQNVNAVAQGFIDRESGLSKQQLRMSKRKFLRLMSQIHLDAELREIKVQRWLLQVRHCVFRLCICIIFCFVSTQERQN